MIGPADWNFGFALQLRRIVHFVFMPLGEALLFMLGSAAALAYLHHPADIATLASTGLLLAVVVALLDRCTDRLRAWPIAHAGTIAAGGAVCLLICLALGLFDTLVDPRSWVWPVIASTTIGTALVMLARFVVAFGVDRLAERSRGGSAVVVSMAPQSHTAAALEALLQARRVRLLRWWRGLPLSADEPAEAGLAIDPIVQSLRALRPTEIFLVLPDEAAEGAASPAMQTQLRDALATLPSRLWQATAGTGQPQLTLLAERPLGHVGRVVKRGLDVVGALLLSLCVLPLLLVVAAAIKLESPGPVIFRQYRVGYNNQPFKIFKFRSMHHSACDVTGSRLTMRGDPRVTRVGRFIRRTSIDELPQLINVLRGDMSLVGPRPYPLDARAGGRPYAEVVANIGRRHRVRPGLTGLAQVSGYRGDTETEARLIGRFALDLEYIDRWSFWLDIKILLRTPLAGMLQADVY